MHVLLISCQTAEYDSMSTPEIFYRKKISAPAFSQIQSARKALIFIIFNTYFVAFVP